MSVTRLTTASAPPAPRHALPPLETLAPFEAFSEEEGRALERLLPALRWPEGATVPEVLRETDQLVVIRAGMLAWHCPTPSGGEVVVGLLGPGDAVPVSGARPPCRMTPIGETWVSSISAEHLQRLIARVPRLGFGLVTALAGQLEETARAAAALSEVRVEDRLMGVFSRLAARHGRVTPEGIRLPMLFTHSRWAELVGASREAVTAALLRLRRRGTVICRGRTVILPPEAAGAVLTGSAPAEPAARGAAA